MGTLNTMDNAFEVVKGRISEQLSEVAYNLWIRDLQITGLDGKTAYLHVKSEFKRDILEERYVPMICEAFSHVMGFDVSVCITYDDDAGTPEPEQSDVEIEYTFDNFIVGGSNKFAHAASLAVAANPANAYNPLFIYGSSGLGKTHLLYAISKEIRESSPDSNIVFVDGEAFTNELIDSINHATTQKFRDKYRQADVFMLDDVQFIGGKESTQEEFFHTFNTLYQSSKQIVMTSDRPPKEIKTLEDRLRTRFEWGLLADIQPPDFETRIAILKRKSEQLKLDMPMDVCEYIASRLKSDIRQLEGTVKKMNAKLIMDKEKPSVILAQSVIKDILSDNLPLPVTIERIIAEVGRTLNVSPEDIRSSKRSANISKARQIAIYVVREVTQIPMIQIGEQFGGRDHSTIVYAIKQVDIQQAKDPNYRELINDILKNIRK